MKDLELHKLASISKLSLDDALSEKISNKILSMIELQNTLSEVKIENEEPMFAVFDLMNQHLNNLRDDTPRQEDLREDILLNVPDKEEVFIAVPKVIDQ